MLVVGFFVDGIVRQMTSRQVCKEINLRKVLWLVLDMQDMCLRRKIVVHDADQK